MSLPGVSFQPLVLQHAAESLKATARFDFYYSALVNKATAHALPSVQVILYHFAQVSRMQKLQIYSRAFWVYLRNMYNENSEAIMTLGVLFFCILLDLGSPTVS